MATDIIQHVIKLERKIQDMKIEVRDIEDFRTVRQFKKDIRFLDKEIKNLKELQKLTDSL